MSRLTLKLLNGAYDLVAGALILSAALFSAYSIWDNAQIYRSAIDVQDSIRQYRPVAEATRGSPAPGFEELYAVNPDVVAWLTLEGVNIDYPVLQGGDNIEYMNKDVYGGFSLAGSIFLHSRCSPDFDDHYLLIYGHNMDQHLMFGDLALYKDRDFFAAHTEAELITPSGTQEYTIAAVLQISAGSDEIFNPDSWEDGFEHLPEYLRETSIWYRSELLELMEAKPWGVQVVSLVTCSSGSTNDRTVLILIRARPDWPPVRPRPDDPHFDQDNPHYDPSNPHYDPSNPRNDHDDPHQGSGGNSPSSGSGPKRTGDGRDPVFWYRLIGGIVVFIALFETVDRIIRRRREEL